MKSLVCKIVVSTIVVLFGILFLCLGISGVYLLANKILPIMCIAFGVVFCVASPAYLICKEVEKVKGSGE